MIEKRWRLKPAPELAKVNHLAESLKINPANAFLLVQRGIENFEQSKAFFRPDINDLHDPYLLKDMDKAVARIEKAIANNEKIMIYGDYDVDGTTSVSMTYHFFKNYLTQNLIFYIPDRYKEGYGVQQPGIDHAQAEGVTLIICIDCGVKSVDLIAYAKSIGIDFIVCDHHLPGAILPPAVAVLDQKRPDCTYPFPELTGCGVAFKLITALAAKKGIDQQKVLEYLDLLACSIASDIVPIVGENRILVYYGLQTINNNPRVGIKALKESADYNKKYSITDVVFKIGPRINAAGRIAHAYDAVNILLNEDPDKSADFAKIINTHNTDRKSFDSNITAEAIAMIEENETEGVKHSTVLYREDWHKGVIGIVASRCIESYHRPTIIFTKTGDNVAAGSGRSVRGFDLHQALENCKQHLIQFGGHMYAAGMSIAIDKINDFRIAFENEVASTINPELLVPEIEIDMEINFEDIDQKFIRIMEQMAPFGPENMSPVFVAKGLICAEEPRILKESHLKLKLKQGENSKIIDAIGFGMVNDFFEKICENKPFDVCFSLEINEFRDTKTVQMMIKDMKFAS